MSNINSDSEKQVQDLLGQVNVALSKNISILQDLNHKIGRESSFSNALDTVNEQFVELCQQFKVPDEQRPDKSKPKSSTIQVIEPDESSSSNK